MLNRISMTAAGLLLAMTCAANAYVIPVDNHSFEAPVRSNGGYLSTADEAFWFSQTAWHHSLGYPTYDNSSIQYFIIYNPVDGNFTGSDTPNTGLSDGSQGIDMGGSNPQSLWQKITSPLGTLEPYRDYSLTVSIGRYAAGNQPRLELRLISGNDFTGTLLEQLVIPYNTVANDSFQDFTINLSRLEALPFMGAHQGESLVVELYSYQFAIPGEIGNSAFLDNVRLSYVDAPEPASLSLLALGSAMVLRRRRSA